MARWLVTQGDRQFTAQDLRELQKLAREGRLGPGDMVQPPGASDWLYAAELPELKGLFTQTSGGMDSDDLEYGRKSLPQIPMIIALLLLVIGGGYAMYHYANQIPDASELDLLGESGLALTEMLITADPATLRSKPEEGASAVGTVAKDSKVQLVAKRGDFYHIKADSGEGWVGVKEVVPAYLFADARTREDYDPIYNPDRYVFVKNSSWMQLPNQQEKNTTLFQFLLQNKSKFEMTDLVLLATIKDKNDRVLEGVEIPIEGSIAPYSSVEVGTLMPEELDDPTAGLLGGRMMTTRLFQDLRKDDPELDLRWSAGVEVQMESEGFVEANIDLLELRAVPKKLD
jgi:hypothetical protein